LPKKNVYFRKSDIPNLEGPIIAPAGNEVGRFLVPADHIDIALMRVDFELRLFLVPDSHVHDLDGPVDTTGGKDLALGGTEIYIFHGFCVVPISLLKKMNYS
jgi:hypothetical protein